MLLLGSCAGNPSQPLPRGKASARLTEAFEQYLQAVADGANGQYILILPEQDAVIVTTANIQNMQQELNLIWDYLLPAL